MAIIASPATGMPPRRAQREVLEPDGRRARGLQGVEQDASFDDRRHAQRHDQRVHAQPHDQQPVRGSDRRPEGKRRGDHRPHHRIAAVHARGEKDGGGTDRRAHRQVDAAGQPPRASVRCSRTRTPRPAPGCWRYCPSSRSARLTATPAVVVRTSISARTRRGTPIRCRIGRKPVAPARDPVTPRLLPQAA